MTAVDTVLIVCGGVAGMSAAIALRRLGIDAEIVEADTQ
jgi:2-polyprenyl-6-methoxyphenol hydroxylase-like FAD-dependent oxidoreductase